MTEQEARFIGVSRSIGTYESTTPPQVAKLLGTLVEHLKQFEEMESLDRQWIIQNAHEAIALFAAAARKRSVETTWIKLNDTAILVNLDNPPEPSWHYCPDLEHVGKGWVTVEKRNSGLYVGNRKVVLFQSARQFQSTTGKYITGTYVIQGHELRKEMAGLGVLNATLLDALLANQHLIPKEWEDLGRYGSLVFWGTVLHNRGSNHRVRQMRFAGRDGWKNWFEHELKDEFTGAGTVYAVILAPESPDALSGRIIDPCPAGVDAEELSTSVRRETLKNETTVMSHVVKVGGEYFEILTPATGPYNEMEPTEVKKITPSSITLCPAIVSAIEQARRS